MLHGSPIFLPLLFIFRHVAEHRIHLRSEIKKNNFPLLEEFSYFSVKYKLGAGACFELNKVSAAKLH